VPAVVEQRNDVLGRMLVDLALGKQLADAPDRLCFAKSGSARTFLIESAIGADALPGPQPGRAVDAPPLTLTAERSRLWPASEQAEQGGDAHPDAVADHRYDDQDEQQTEQQFHDFPPRCALLL
jgi:hypothetical protein